MIRAVAQDWREIYIPILTGFRDRMLLDVAKRLGNNLEMDVTDQEQEVQALQKGRVSYIWLAAWPMRLPSFHPVASLDNNDHR
jgi:hypothetical protein